MSKEMLTALETLEAEKGIAKEIVIEALEAALISAYKRHYGQAQNVEVEFDQKKGDIHVYAVKEVTEEVMDSQLEVSIKDATAINPHYEIGDKIRFEVTPKDFGRIAAQTAKQVIVQKIREASRNYLFDEFNERKGEIVSGIVQKADGRTGQKGRFRAPVRQYRHGPLLQQSLVGVVSLHAPFAKELPCPC